MRAIDRKLIRDFWRLRGQVIAVVVVAACGVASFVAMQSNYYSLQASQTATYEKYRFANVFASVKQAPLSIAPRIAAISGVAAVDTRIVKDVTLDVPGLNEPATGRLISIPESKTDVLNDFFLKQGRYIEAGKRNAVIISEAFAEANDLKLDDSISAVINGHWQSLKVVGIALSPEYVYGIRGGEIFPDSRRFGVMWISRETLEHTFDMAGAFNDVSLLLTAGANERDIIAKLDAILDEYGGHGAYGREDQPSHVYLNNEIQELRTTGTFIPTIFLAVTAFLLNLVMTRFVSTQREQIAVLKAFGYDNMAVGWHYLKFVFVTISFGAALGVAFGIYIGSGITDLYAQFFRFPLTRFEISYGVLITAVTVSIGAGVIGAASAILRALKLPPAEAMRPEPPTRFQAGFIERLGWHRILSPSSRIIFRNLTRHPVKATITALAISLSVMMLVVGFYMYFDALTRIIFVQFRVIQREDVAVYFINPESSAARYDLENLDGVLRVEPFRFVPVRLRNEHYARRMSIIGLESNSELRRLVDSELNRVAIPPDGVVLTTKLAEIMHTEPGDLLTIEVLEGNRPIRQVRVAGLIDEMIGLSVYMNKQALNSMLNEGESMSGAYLKVDQNKAQHLYSSLKNTPTVSGVGVPEAVLANFNDTISKTMLTSISFIIGFASVIAMGIVYNGARIALAERGRELASLRVLGFTRREVTTMLLGEQGFLTVLAVPFGWVLGYGLCVLIINVVNTELIRLPLMVSLKTYVYAFLVVLASAVISGLLVSWRIRSLDLIEALKTRE